MFVRYVNVAIVFILGAMFLFLASVYGSGDHVSEPQWQDVSLQVEAWLAEGDHSSEAEEKGGVKSRAVSAAAFRQPIDINTATRGELDRLPGIGTTKAEAIIAYREENGPFRAVEDVMKVKGIGTAIFEDIRTSIAVDF
jgi:competence ComEA-like helix-hairpin-helix protein